MGFPVLLLASAVSTLGGLVFGYELGIISGALLQLRAEFSLSCVQQEALVSSLLVGALLASIVGGGLIDHQGRRRSIILSNVLILIGSLILVVSSYAALVFGRIMVGFAMCISSMSCCIFVSEMVTPNRRGVLVTLYEAGVTVGILAAYAMNYILSDSREGWKLMFGLALVPTLLQLVCVLFLPSNASGSQHHGDGSQSETALVRTNQSQDSDDSKVVENNTWFLFQRKDNMRTRTIIGLGLVLFQQFTGQPNVLFYASTIFHSVGFQSDASAVLASVGLGIVKVVATLTSMVFSDRVGRRPLLISGCSVMAVCLITIGLLSGHSTMNTKRPCDANDLSLNTTNLPRLTGFNQSVTEVPFDESQRLLDRNFPSENPVHDEDKPTDSPMTATPSAQSRAVNWIILLCMMAVVSAYSVGFGPMTWLLLSEIFPAAVRGRAFAFTSCFNWGANLLVTFTFLNVIDAIGLSGMFVLYGILSVAAAVFFHFMLPETKGKTLEQIDMELSSNRFDQRDKCCGLMRSSSGQYERVLCQDSTPGRSL